MPIEIKHRITGGVLKTVDAKSLSHADLRFAELRFANLSHADLRDADLRDADLHGAILSHADLSDADLSNAILSHADLRYANLSHAELRYANLSHADLSHANLSHANLRDADLRGAKDIPPLAAAQALITPEGDLIVFKNLREGVATLRIPADARRHNATGRKCRAEAAVVIALPEGCTEGHSRHDETFVYRVGETVTPREPFCEDRWQECASGIHFFLTREEAENWS